MVLDPVSKLGPDYIKNKNRFNKLKKLLIQVWQLPIQIQGF